MMAKAANGLALSRQQAITLRRALEERTKMSTGELAWCIQMSDVTVMQKQMLACLKGRGFVTTGVAEYTYPDHGDEPWLAVMLTEQGEAEARTYPAWGKGRES